MPNSFDIPLPSLVPSSPPPFQRPKSLLSFSYSANHTLLFDDSALNIFVQPPEKADLNYGYESWIKRPEEIGRLDGLLTAIVTDPARSEAKRADVVTWRGIMTKILVAPYEDSEGWDLNVMSVNGTLYIEEHIDDAKLQSKSELTPQHRLFSYYGFAFESYCTAPPPLGGQPFGRDGPKGWGGTVNTNIQWCQVVKTKLDSLRLVIGGEVDCVKGSWTGSTDSLVELKTTMALRSPRDEAKFERKLLKFWAQSYLLGVPEVFVGFRTPAGILDATQSFQTLEIPRIVRGKGPHSWDAGVCLNFANQFLQQLRRNLTVDDGSTSQRRVWRARLVPKQYIAVRELIAPEELLEVQGNEDRVGFLPAWYWKTIAKGK